MDGKEIERERDKKKRRREGGEKTRCHLRGE
jgi:hypothetical protein